MGTVSTFTTENYHCKLQSDEIIPMNKFMAHSLQSDCWVSLIVLQKVLFFWHGSTTYRFDFLQDDRNYLVCEIPRSFERSSPSNFRTQGSFIHINSGKIFERHLLSSDSVAKSATQKPSVFWDCIEENFFNRADFLIKVLIFFLWPDQYFQLMTSPI